MSGFCVSRLIGDHMVLQYGRPVHLWGKGTPGIRVEASIGQTHAQGWVGDDGAWSLFLPAMEAQCDPQELVLSDEQGEQIVIRDVLVGAVYFASGQSNMDLMMERVRDRYPGEIASCDERCIRCFKIAEHTDYHGPLTEPLTGEWMRADTEHIEQFSASGYFFAKHYNRLTGIPVGFVHASLGGSRISCWMNRSMLADPSDAVPQGYPHYLEEADRYASDSFREAQVKKNETQAAKWNAELAAREKNGEGAKPPFTVALPCHFADVPALRGFIGSLKLTKKFTVTQEMLAAAGEQSGSRAPKAGDPGVMRLFLGTMVDRDVTEINGVRVGETGYQYPPRKYEIPRGVLHPGENEVSVHLVVETGLGRVTPDKKYSIFCEKEYGKTDRNTGGEILAGEDNIAWEVDLSGDWTCEVLAAMDEPVPETDFINWHPTGLFNGMAAPCTAVTIEGFLWYQGEANTHLPEDYEDLQRRLMRGWRELWAASSGKVSFIYVQLPNFVIDAEVADGLENLRDRQARCLSEPRCGMVDAMGYGEDNDLHPHEKEPIGRMLAEKALEVLRG